MSIDRQKIIFSLIILFLCYSGIYIYPRTIKKRFFYPNFSDVPIKEFIKVMSDILRKNIIIPKNIQGKITIYAPKGIPIKKAYEILVATLSLYDYGVEDKGSYIKIFHKRKTPTASVIEGSYSPYLPKNKVIIKVIELKNTSAFDIETIIRKLGYKYIKAISFPQNNTIILFGFSNDISGITKLILKLDRHSLPQKYEDITGDLHIYPLNHADVKSVAKAISSLNLYYEVESSDVRKGGKFRKKERIIVTPYKDTNSLIIKAPPKEYLKIKNIIRKLDIPRKQLMITANIVEIAMQGTELFGVDWQVGSAKEENGTIIWGGAGQNVGIKSDLLQNSTGDTISDRIKQSLLPGLSFGIIRGEGDAFAILNTAMQKNRFKVLSNPQILVLDNNEAEINVGQEIPIVSNVRVTDQNTIIKTYQYKSVGIKLKIVPHINPKDYITLELTIEIQSLYGVNISENPIITKRNVKTKLFLKSGKTVVIGGLIKENTSEQKSSWKLGPIDLSYIPVLGRLFRKDASSSQKTNILIFIRPIIIKQIEKGDK
jgi:general secretion pathway protein D